MAIPAEVTHLLESDRHGITFPCQSGCQMRFIHQGKDLGGFYSYRQWGGIKKAVEAAIQRNTALRAKYGRGKAGRIQTRSQFEPRSNVGVVGVSSSRYFDKRRQRYYFRYLVAWADGKGRRKVKSFNLLANSTPDQYLHAYRSAIQFRKEWEALLAEFSPSKYTLWRDKRLYAPGTPTLPADFWSDRPPTTQVEGTGTLDESAPLAAVEDNWLAGNPITSQHRQRI